MNEEIDIEKMDIKRKPAFAVRVLQGILIISGFLGLLMSIKGSNILGIIMSGGCIFYGLIYAKLWYKEKKE